MEEENAIGSSGVDSVGRYLTEAGDVCELCGTPGGEVVWEDDFVRVVRIVDADYPGFCRVILHHHVAEMTDLPAGDRQRLMAVVYAVEEAVRTTYQPDKINLASFGNVVPHLHWHVIPRWRDDRHFPQPVWGSAQRIGSPARPPVSNRHLGETIANRLARRNTGD